MTQNANTIFAGLGQDPVTGTVLRGPFGTTLPATDTTFFESALDSAFVDGGFIGEAGVTLAPSRSFTDIKDMDGNVVDSLQSEFNSTIATNFLELNSTTLGAVFGDDAVSTALATLTAGNRIAVAISGTDIDPCSWVFRMRSGKRKRGGIVIPKGRITDSGQLAFTSSGAASIDVTIKTIPVWDSVRQEMVDAYLILDDGVYVLSTVPTILTALPSAVVAGNQVTLTGSRFTGTTGITVGGVAVGSGKFTVVNDGVIVFTMPAGSAGPAPIIVTNGSGSSAAKAYTRGA
jgi:hypothetical protein